MAASRARRTPLALAVLSLLNERPMHPYEMQALIRDRHVGRVVRMRGGSVYDAVARLAAHDLIAPTGSSRAGARPERTTFTITAAGRAELDSLLDEYLAEPVNEYPRFAAGLAHILNLTP
ncbi:PadR family transcriptional regulator, partial [Streptomyces lydicus]